MQIHSISKLIWEGNTKYLVREFHIDFHIHIRLSKNTPLKLISGAGEMAPRIKQLPAKHEDLNSDPTNARGLVSVSAAVVKYSDQNNLGKKRAYSAVLPCYSSLWREVRAGTPVGA